MPDTITGVDLSPSRPIERLRAPALGPYPEAAPERYVSTEGQACLPLTTPCGWV
jgi:hypothetical protein